MKILPIGTSRLHEPLSLVADQNKVLFPGIGYFHSPRQIRKLIDTLLGHDSIDFWTSRFFFRKDQTPSNKFQEVIWSDRENLRNIYFKRLARLFEQANALVIEISTLKSFLVGGMAVQGNPNYYRNVPYSEIWKSNYYHTYHPNVECSEVCDDEILQDFFCFLDSLSSKTGKPILIVGHLVDNNQPNPQRERHNNIIRNCIEKTKSLRFYEASHLIEKFGFRVLDGGVIDIHHLPWDALEEQAIDIVNIVSAMLVERSNANKDIILPDAKGIMSFGIRKDNSHEKFNQIKSLVDNYDLFGILSFLNVSGTLLNEGADNNKTLESFFCSIKLSSEFIAHLGLQSLAANFDGFNWSPLSSDDLNKIISLEEKMENKVTLFFSHYDWSNPTENDALFFSKLFVSTASYNPYLYNFLHIHPFICKGVNEEAYIKCMFRLGRFSEVLNICSLNVTKSALHRFYLNLALSNYHSKSELKIPKELELDQFDEYARLNILRQEEIDSFPYATKANTSSNLKVAICISGQLRGYEACIDNWLNFFKEHFEVDVYFSTWDSNPSPKFSKNNLNRVFTPKALDFLRRITNYEGCLEYLERYLVKGNEEVTVETLSRFYPKKHLIVNEDDFETLCRDSFGDLTVYQKNQLKMFYQIEASFKLIENVNEYSLFVRLRPDLGFSNLNLSDIYKTMYYPGSVGVLLNQADGIDDKFALLHPSAIKRYSTVWTELYESKNLNYLGLDSVKLAESLVLRHSYAAGLNPFLLSSKFGGLHHKKYDLSSLKQALEKVIIDRAYDSDFCSEVAELLKVG